jgi:hypothetical protein
MLLCPAANHRDLSKAVFVIHAIIRSRFRYLRRNLDAHRSDSVGSTRTRRALVRVVVNPWARQIIMGHEHVGIFSQLPRLTAPERQEGVGELTRSKGNQLIDARRSLSPPPERCDAAKCDTKKSKKPGL